MIDGAYIQSEETQICRFLKEASLQNRASVPIVEPLCG
jgi:hypothetical protein